MHYYCSVRFDHSYSWAPAGGNVVLWLKSCSNKCASALHVEDCSKFMQGCCDVIVLSMITGVSVSTWSLLGGLYSIEDYMQKFYKGNKST